MKIFLQELNDCDDAFYTNENLKTPGDPLVVMKREYGKTPNGNNFGGSWVLRFDGVYRDHNKYRTDLAGQNNLDIEFNP